MKDIFDGEQYKALRKKLIMVMGKNLPAYYFSNHQDIALGLAADGVGVFKKHSKTCWPFSIFNYNLPPGVWFQMGNIITAGIICGPNKPLEMDSFLHPLVQELV